MNLYTTYAKSFSDTRKTSWAGWNNLIPVFEKLKELKVLDLGCGNGRLYKILDTQFTISNYLGIDNSPEMIGLAKSENEEDESVTFRVMDLESSKWNEGINEKFNVICAFGLMHHISSYSRRIEILEKSCELLEKGGLLVFAFWQFGRFPNFLSKHLIEDKGNNDYILSWKGKTSGANRFAHDFNDEEIEKYKKYFSEKLNLVSEFNMDGVENKMNKYLVWEKA